MDYLGEASLAGEADDLKEQAVGVAALGKSSGYDPQQDSSVRVHVNRLRHKLVEYYATEGAGDPIELSIPRGHFKVVYQTRKERKSNGELAAGARMWRRRATALGAIAVLCAGLAFYWRTAPPREGGPEAVPLISAEERLFWVPYLTGDRPVLVSLGTPLFVWIDGHYYRPGDALKDPSEVSGSQDVKAIADALEAGTVAPVFRFAAAGDSLGAFELGKRFAGMGIDVGIRKSSELTWAELGESNLIFVGAPKFNRQLRFVLPGGAFKFVAGGIRNSSPAPGEEAYYRNGRSDDGLLPVEDYALISRVPGLHGKGYATVFASHTTFGSRAAVEFCTSPRYVLELTGKLSGGTGKIPDFFEVVVRAELEEGNPVRVSYVTHHVIDSEKPGGEGPLPPI